MRRFFLILGFLATFTLIAVALLPWWLPPVLRGVGHHYGATFVRYERLGYGRFAVHDVTVTRSNVVVHVDRAETETPLLWLGHWVSGHPAAIVTTTWRVDVKPGAPSPSAPATPNGGALHTRAILLRVARALDRWVPRAEIGSGIVTWPGSELRLDRALWQQRTLTVQPLRWKTQAAEVRAIFTANDEIRLEAQAVGDPAWQAKLASQRDEITGELGLWDQRAPLTARLPAQGWMPAALEVRAEHWTMPAAKLKLGENYAAVHGDATLDWREGHFAVKAEATGEPLRDKKAPPLTARLHATGDRESVAIDALALEIPGGRATLSDPIVLQRQGGTPRGAAHFAVDLDLEKQPWLANAKGRASGRAEVESTAAAMPRITATLEAQDLALGDWSLPQLKTALALDWPRLQVQEAVLGFADGGKFTLRGGWDFHTREVLAATAEGEVKPSVIAHWLPEKIGFDALIVSAKAHGPLSALQHEGHGRIATLQAGAAKPMSLAVAWQSDGQTTEISEARLDAGQSRVTLTGKIEASGAQITALKLVQGTDERLALASPATVTWSPQVSIGGLELKGGDASVRLTANWGEQGRVEVGVRNFPSMWLDDFVAVPGPEWRITALDGQGNWERGPLNFSTRGEVVVTLAPERFANVTVAAQGDGAGIKVEALRVAEGAAPIVNANGQLPLTLHPGAKPFVRLEKDAALTLHATTASNPAFWQKLTEATGLEFQAPEVSAELSGTWAKPRGEVSAKAARVAFDARRIKFSFPTVESLTAHATADDKGLTLDQFDVKIEGQEVRAKGALPLTPERWAEFRQAPLAYLRREGNAHLEIPDAEVAALARYTGTYLAPAGRMHVDVTFQRGGEMSGSFRLRDAATRPLGPLGVLQEVQAEAVLTGRDVEIKNVTAQAGGQPVTLTGKIQVPIEGHPKFDLALKGQNLPLVRQTGLLLRADLDLKLSTGSNDVTSVTGAVNLRDSMFLSDVRALIPKGGGGSPSRRPPFFAIENPPLNTWRLGVDVRGDQFLRLRSTVFVGVASAHFRLSGTLGEPRATGEATVNTGQVLLPFATFAVEQGTVRLTEADPYALRLFLTGTSRRYGYDLRMELTGTAADPQVTFSSSPPLDAKQVLLMVTAGELPHDEIVYGGAQRVARLGTYLGQSLINTFGGDATEADRLNISTGERVSRQGRETYNIEYQLSDRMAVVGEYDEFDGYNAGVKWRIFVPQKSPPKNDTAARRPAEDAKEATHGSTQ